MMENYQYFVMSLVACFKVVNGQEYTGILASTTVAGVMLIILIIVGAIIVTWEKWFPSYMRNNGWTKCERIAFHHPTKPILKLLPKVHVQPNVRTGINGRRSSLPIFPREMFVGPKAASEIHELRRFSDDHSDYVGIEDRFPKTKRSSPVAFSKQQDIVPNTFENLSFNMDKDPELGKEVVYASVNRPSRHMSLENLNREFDAKDDIVSTLLLY